MGWPKGKPMHGAAGRPPGAKNKKTNLFAMCEEKGINVFEELLTSAAAEEDPDKRFHKFKEIAPYLYAKKKEVLNLADAPVEELLDAAEAQINGSGVTSSKTEELS